MLRLGRANVDSVARDLAAAALWRLVDIEAGAWRRRRRSPRLWWRDDDARTPSARLERLMDLSNRHRIPVTLAVIPDVDLADLVSATRRSPGVEMIQHGCDHVDRSSESARSSEFHPLTPPSEVRQAIESGWSRLAGATRAIPIFAPPWNVMTPNVREALRDTPLRAVSLIGAVSDLDDGLREINTHLDIMLWRPPRFRGDVAILAKLWRLLRARRRTGRWDEPIGLLTHHRNLDEDAWRFLERFLVRTSREGEVFSWRRVSELLADLPAPLAHRPI
jgi:peptidoglycan/xylan/chitin deacetylase (PgdA/CDA1 family)